MDVDDNSFKRVQRINAVPCTPTKNILKGAFLRRPFDNNKKQQAVIFYASDLNSADYRFTLIKELSHIFDRENEWVPSTEALYDNAIVEVEGLTPKTPSQKSEVFARDCSIELLIPYLMRKEKLEKQSAAEINYKSLANKLQMPIEIVRRAFGDDYMYYIEGLRKKAGLA